MTDNDPFREVFASYGGLRLEHLTGKQWIIVDAISGECQRVTVEQTKADIRAAVKRFGDERTVSTYLRLSDGNWQPLYKPGYRA